MSSGGLRREVHKQSTHTAQTNAGHLVSPKSTNNHANQGYDTNEPRHIQSKSNHGSSYKPKSISAGRQGQGQPAAAHHQNQQHIQPTNNITPLLQSAQSMSSLSKPFNGNGGRVLISPTNFTTVRGTTNNGHHAQQQQTQQQQHSGHNLGASQTVAVQQRDGGAAAASRRHQQHGSLGKLSSHKTLTAGSSEPQQLIDSHTQQQMVQMRADQNQQNSQSYLKQLRKSQISALRQLKKPAGEQHLQPGVINKVERIGSTGVSTGLVKQSSSKLQPQGNVGTPSYPKLSLSDRHGANQQKLGSQDQLLSGQNQNASNQQAQPTQLESEYGSLGRQDQKIRFYQSRDAHHPMSRQAAAGNGVVLSNKGSDENSDDFQAVAEEDMGSFILHRNAYLEGDIITAESQLFKQQPKQGRDPRPNPNSHSGKSQQVQATQSSQGLAYQRGYSSQKQLITGSVASQLSHHSGGRLSSQNTQTPMQVEEIVSAPTSIVHGSEAKQSRRHGSNSGLGGAATTMGGSKSNRKTIAGQTVQMPSLKPQINTLAGPSDYQPVRALTTLAGPVQTQSFGGQQNDLIASQSQSEQKRRATNNKGMQRVEAMTSMGVTKPQYPMFPLEDNKKAMIQFEMNLLARVNKQAAAASYSHTDSNQHGTNTLLNKATLCDSTNSKYNSQNSAFLRKSLWLLTSMKNKALKEAVQTQQANCQACHYLRKQGVGCFAQNQAIQTPSIHHAQTFIYNQNDSHGNAGIGLGGPIGRGNLAQSVVVTLPPDKQGSSSTQDSNIYKSSANGGILTVTKKDVNSSLISRQQQIQKRHTQKRANIKQTSQTGIIDKTQGGISSQGVNWLGSMGTQILLVESYEHDFWKLLTQKTLNTKYLTSQEYYNSKIAADIMYNEQRHIVSVFKEYLIFDDFSEYLKRFYTFKEAQDRLPRVFEFYEHYSKVFPNYVSVPESKYMFKNIERKQKLIDQRHQVFIKNQAKEGKDMDGKAAAYKHSANMLFGSQFLKEVFNDDDKSMSRVSFEIRAAEKERILNEKFSLTVQSKQPKPQQTLFQSPGFDQKKMKLMAHNPDFISPQAKQAQAARNISRKGPTSIDASNVKHQNELENVISMLSKFEQSRRGEESQSISISRSYVEGATGMGANPKQTPSRVAALQSDASRKNLKNKIIKKHDKHLASHTNLDEVKKSHRAGEFFTDGWNFAEPTHDLSMSSWALTSFVKNGEEQPSGVAGLGSIVDTGSVGPFQAEDLSIDDFSKIVLDSSKRQNKRAEIKKNSVEDNIKTQKRLYIQSDAIGPQSGIKIMRASETQLNHLSPSGPGTTTSKHARRAIENRRNSAISPKAGDSSKALQSVALVQKSALEQKTTGTQLMKTSRHEREKIKQTPQREEKQSVKKKATVVSKTGQNNLANSRCRSKLSIGSSQTQTQQTMTQKKAVQTHNKKQIEKMIKDSSLKLQLDKTNRHHLVTVQKRTGLGSTTNVLMKGQMSIGQNLASLAAQNEPIHAGSGQIYNTSQHSVNPKSQKSNQNTQAAINSSRNAKQSSTNGGIKSNSQLASAAVGAGSIETSSAYKSSGHIPSVVIQGSKVFKATGYEDQKGINERFIDLNKASEGAPKISKPTINTVLKSNDFSQMKGSTQGIRLGDQSAKNPSNSNQGLLASVSTQQQINSVRTGQSSLGFRKGSETQSIMVVNQQISPMNSGPANKLQQQVKTVQRTYHNRPLNKPEHIIHGSEISNQGHALANQKSPATKMQSSSNLPQIFKKEQKEGKTIRPSHYDVQLKTIFKHDTPSANQYTSVPAQQSNLMYTTKNKKQSPEQTSIHFNTQHVASKSHEPKERQKSEPINMNNAQSTANSVIGHNSQHGLMLLSQNNGHQMMNQASSSVGPQSTTNARKDHHGKMDGNMLIQNNILQKNSGHLQSQLGSSTKASNNPYSKTGRILNSLNNQKQSVQSLGHMSGTSASGSHHIKGGRNAKLNVKATSNNHALKGTTAQSVSSSSSIGSSKISLNSHHGKSDSSQIYLKTLSRGHAQNHMQTGMGTKSTMVIRKTPSGSNSSSKTKKIKVTSTNSGSATVTKTKLKSTTTATKNTAQNPYPAGAAHGQTIFSVTVPRQSLQQTINSGVQQVNSNRLNNHHHA